MLDSDAILIVVKKNTELEKGFYPLFCVKNVVLEIFVSKRKFRNIQIFFIGEIWNEALSNY